VILQRIGEIRPEERRGAGAAFVTLLGTLAGHTLLETARDALFLARLPPSQLPWAYLAIAVLAVAIFQGPWRPTSRSLGRHGVSLALLASGGVTLGFWLLPPGEGELRGHASEDPLREDHAARAQGAGAGAAGGRRLDAGGVGTD
jgi:hypothetical protein